MDLIGGGVKRELSRLGPAGRIQDVVAVWPAAVGPEIARHAWPARIGRDGTLHVAVSSSSWAFELTQLAGTITARLADALEQAPSVLRFAPGLLPDTIAEEPAERARRPRFSPDQATLEQAAAITAGIADPDLRAAVSRAAAASLARASSSRRF